MKITNIVWDTDDEPVEGLPAEVVIAENIDENDVADYLSDEYGFCVKGFSIDAGAKKKFRVAYTVTKVEEEIIEAESFDEAQKKWEAEGLDAELFFIRDTETDEEVVFD